MNQKQIIEAVNELKEEIDKNRELLLKNEAQNRKCINILSDNDHLEIQEAYSKIINLAQNKGKVPTDVAEQVLPLESKQAVLRHMRSVVEQSEELVFQEGKGNKSAKIRHEKTVLASADAGHESKSEELAAARSWLGG